LVYTLIHAGHRSPIYATTDMPTNFVLQPWQMLLLIISGWMNRQQQNAIEYLRTENSVLREKLGKKRLLLNDDQRRRLAVKGKVLGRKQLNEVGTLFTPDTILRWHRQLVAKKWDHSDRQKTIGRPRIRKVIVDSIVSFARENPTWGYDRIQGALANVGYHIANSTVANVLKAHGIEPAPNRQRSLSWGTFLNAHWDSVFATDFTTVEVWTRNGLITFYVMAVMHLKTRRVHVAGITTNPHTAWMKQACRHLTDAEDGFLKDASHLIVDRDASFLALREYIGDNIDTEIVLLPPRSPNLNSYLERWFRSLKSECLDRMIFFGRRSLEKAIGEYVEHYHVERNHQGLGNQLIEPGDSVDSADGTVDCRERLGGLLKYYHRAA
jgi:putative transposase